MPDRTEVQQAKQILSASLLRAGLRGGIVGRTPAVRIEAAIANSGQNVHAVGIGRKIVNGHATNELCVRVYVVQKIAASLLPPIYRIPEAVDGVPTDIIESAPAFVLGTRSSRKRVIPDARPSVSSVTVPCSTGRRQRQRPLTAGISVAHFNVTAGTLAYFCRSLRHGDDPSHIYVLSNNHVFADVNRAQPGDDIYQPGRADGGNAGDYFADLARFVTIRLGGTIPNKVDAAIARLRQDVAHQSELCSIGRITGIGEATEGLSVRKHGRTTGYTEGRITDDSYDALVGMDHGDPSVVALFQNQMRIERIEPFPAIGLGGDSGSLVVSREEPHAVGLYFAGPPSGTYGVANHINDVLNELEIQLLL